MARVPNQSSRRRYTTAADWPEWTDAYRYVTAEVPLTGPSEADARWAAENMNDTSHDVDLPVPPEVYDRQAEEAAAVDRHERGLRL